MTILVIGGTGHIGAEVVKALAKSGEAVRATSRKPARFPSGVEGAVVDLNDPATLRAALPGVRAVFAYAEPETAPALVTEMNRAGVKQIVLLSSEDAAENDMSDFNSRRHRIPETIFEQSGLDWTFLRPVAFASNALFWKDQIRLSGAVRSPYPEASQSVIHPADIGEVAMKALTSPALIAKAPILTGPESLSQRRQVEIISETIGRDIGFHALTPDVAREMLSRFIPPEYVELKLTALAKTEARPDGVTGEVEAITGHAARPFRQWVKENAAAFV